MSADNWTQCPKCTKAQRDAAATRDRQLQEAYGKVSAAEYLKMATAPLPTVTSKDMRTDTFREDYEIGVYEGVFEIDYGGECQKCGFKVVFNHKRSVFE